MPAAAQGGKRQLADSPTALAELRLDRLSGYLRDGYPPARGLALERRGQIVW